MTVLSYSPPPTGPHTPIWRVTVASMLLSLAALTLTICLCIEPRLPGMSARNEYHLTNWTTGIVASGAALVSSDFTDDDTLLVRTFPGKPTIMFDSSLWEPSLGEIPLLMLLLSGATLLAAKRRQLGWITTTVLLLLALTLPALVTLLAIPYVQGILLGLFDDLNTMIVLAMAARVGIPTILCALFASFWWAAPQVIDDPVAISLTTRRRPPIVWAALTACIAMMILSPLTVFQPFRHSGLPDPATRNLFSLCIFSLSLVHAACFAAAALGLVLMLIWGHPSKWIWIPLLPAILFAPPGAGVAFLFSALAAAGWRELHAPEPPLPTGI